MPSTPVIYWLRQDFRLNDNPALFHAAKEKQPVIFLYIFDDSPYDWQLGEASRWWLHEGLTAFDNAIFARFGARLVLKKGEPLDILRTLIKETNAGALYWNRCYEPYYIKRDNQIKLLLKEQNIKVNSFNGALLKEPWEVLNQSKQPFKVFTPFWRTLQNQIIRDIYPLPKGILPGPKVDSLPLEKLHLLPSLPWYASLAKEWQPGEKTAQDKLKHFLKYNISDYKTARDYPAQAHTSKLSPHLHFGEISPVQIWHAAKSIQSKTASHDSDITHFLSELAWREFSTHQLYHFPELPNTAFKTAFNKFPWKKNTAHIKAWQKGLTGYPIVDAGMRELWHTGWMHNRVRMIVASFLIKHLMQPWQEGERWFWDTLVDADLANNAASWQWVAGSGADAAPYFRIFNPVIQGQKFDPDGTYVKKWVPELQGLTPKDIHAPWTASDAALKQANIVLGKTYPSPLVEHAIARERALAAYQKIRK